MNLWIFFLLHMSLVTHVPWIVEVDTRLYTLTLQPLLTGL